MLNSVDIFHDIPAEMIFVRYLFKILGLASRRCSEKPGDDFLVEEVSILLMYCVHIFQSGKSDLSVFILTNWVCR